MIFSRNAKGRVPVLWLAVVASCFAWGAGAAAYYNPLDLGYAVYAPGGGLADPCVVRWMGNYYLYTTKDGETQRVWRSGDLVEWTMIAGDIAPDSRYEHAWSPDVYYHDDGYFYLYHSGPEGERRGVQRVMRSDRPWGPFEELTGDLWPDKETIDITVFRDDDGQLYCTYADLDYAQGGAGPGIRYCRLLDPLTPDAQHYRLADIHVDIPISDPFYTEGHEGEEAWMFAGVPTWTEGAQILRHHPRSGPPSYYIAYSGCNWLAPSYQAWVGRGASIAELRPQEVFNPTLAKQSYSLPADPFVAPGENHIVLGPDMQNYWTVYHVRLATSNQRRICLDPVDFSSAELRVNEGGAPRLDPTVDYPAPPLADWVERFTARHIDWSAWHAANTGGLEVPWLKWNDSDIDHIYANSADLTDSLGPGWPHIPGWSYLYSDAASDANYVAEFNLKAGWGKGRDVAWPKYGAFVSYAPGPSGFSMFSVWLAESAGMLVVHAYVNGQDMGWDNYLLPDDFNFEAWHAIRIRKVGDLFHIWLDQRMIATRTQPGLGEGHWGYIIEDSHAEFGAVTFTNDPDSAAGNWVLYR